MADTGDSNRFQLVPRRKSARLNPVKRSAEEGVANATEKAKQLSQSLRKQLGNAIKRPFEKPVIPNEPEGELLPPLDPPTVTEFTPPKLNYTPGTSSPAVEVR
jgi:hypothetical protein